MTTPSNAPYSSHTSPMCTGACFRIVSASRASAGCRYDGRLANKTPRSGKRLGSERQILHEPHIVAGTHSMPLLKEKERHVHRTPGAAAPCTGRVAGARFLRKQKLFEQGRHASAVKRGFLAIYRLAQAIDPGNPDRR